MYPQSNEAVKLAVQAELLEAFSDLHTQESRIRERQKAQRQLAARRAIEQHYERKRLEHSIKDPWADS
ncbi:MAG: hypothetical protein LPK85_15895 [Gammaproteobacteria bacterium]|nr:hypothetical protein [Gammaproteobacteria bacterium]